MAKRLLLAVGLLGIALPALAGPSSPPSGNYIQNVSTTATRPAFAVSSGTVSSQFSLPFLNPGDCLTTNSDGTVTTQPCGSGTAYVRDAFSARFGSIFNVATAVQALDAIFEFQYQGPGVTLTSTYPVTTEEFGTSVSSIQLTATTVEVSSPITTLQFKANGTLIFNYLNPHPAGGVQVWSDTTPITATTAFNAYAGDGTSTTTSNTVTFTFVYPYYYGVGAQHLTGAQVQALTKIVKAKSDTTTVTSPINQVYYFAYPQTYGLLTSIIDQNGFQTLLGYTQRSVVLTMLDSTNQNYFIYEFNTPTTQTSFSNTYKY